MKEAQQPPACESPAKSLHMAAWTCKTLVAAYCGWTTRQEQACRSRAFLITPALALSFVHLASSVSKATITCRSSTLSGIEFARDTEARCMIQSAAPFHSELLACMLLPRKLLPRIKHSLQWLEGLTC